MPCIMIEISVFAPCCHTHYQRFSRRKLLFHIFHTIYKVFIYDACVFIQYIYPFELPPNQNNCHLSVEQKWI